ncbi:hypothetical protein OAT00_00885 [Pelagibacteraceae bacterium]|nr:hypothetical protein [Pelagibacteraceae bacterium]
MKKKIFIIFLLYFFLDLIITNFLFKKTDFWRLSEKQSPYWRIQSNIYSHDFAANMEVKEKWQNFYKTIITNSLGYRDDTKQKIEKVSNNKRVYIIGDSFIEGMGYDYKHTVAGILKEKLSKNYQILNAGVSSYASGIYYLKTKKLISEGYKIDYAIIFLDLSDIYDELFYIYSDDKSRIINHDVGKEKKIPFLKRNFYSLGNFLTENTILFKILLLMSDKTEIYKNYIKLKFKASKEFNKNFFKTSKEDTLFYRMLNIDRGAWTKDEGKFKEVKSGIEKTKFNLKRLFKLLNENNIESRLIIYPWPIQIYYGDEYHQKIWEKFSKENKINFVNLYSAFDSKDKKKIILNNFILGDIHWNKQGNKTIANEILKLKIFNPK